MKKIILTCLVLAVGHINNLFAMPNSRSAELNTVMQMALEKGRLTEDQQSIFSALGLETNKATCEFLLGDNSTVFASTPSWILDAAKISFIEGRKLSDDVAHQLRSFKVRSEKVKIALTYPTGRKIKGPQLNASVVASYLNMQSAELVKPVDVNILVDSLYVNQTPGQNTFGIDIRLRYGNGEIQSFQFASVPIGSRAIETAVSDFIVTLINYRETLSDIENLRQQVNALRYDLLKLVRVGDPKFLGQLQSLIAQLESAFPSGLRSMFTTDKKAKQKAFMTLLSVQSSLITLSQQVQAQSRRPVEIIRNSFPQRVMRPASPRSSLRSRYDDDEYGSTFWSTYGWITDPSFMMSHPWYWGARDNSFWGNMLMFQMLTDHSRYDRAQTQQIFPTERSYDTRLFGQPIDPVFTANPQSPVVDAWNTRGVDPNTVIRPELNPSTGLGWSDVGGAPIVLDHAVAVEGWRDFKAGDTSEDNTPTSTINLDRDERERVNPGSGSRDGDWQSGPSPQPERDSTINAS